MLPSVLSKLPKIAPPQDANVAQLVEQLTRNEQVVGSSPTVGSPGGVELEASPAQPRNESE